MAFADLLSSAQNGIRRKGTVWVRMSSRAFLSWADMESGNVGIGMVEWVSPLSTSLHGP